MARASRKKYKHQWYLEHREKQHQRYIEYHKKHHKAMCAKEREKYRDDADYRTKKKASRQAYHVIHRKEENLRSKEYRKKYPEQIKINNARHREDHKEHKRIRRARMKGSNAIYIKIAILRRKWKEQKGRCYYCGRQMGKDGPIYDSLRATIDHVIPLAREGPHRPSNIVWACRQCNISKKAQLPSAFSGMLDL